VFEKTKISFDQNPNSRMVKVALVIGALATTYAAAWLLQHGLDPNLSKRDTLRTAVGGYFNRNNFEDISNTDQKVLDMENPISLIEHRS
jgi:hypothetical protein